MASKPRPNKSFLLRLENLPDEVRQATKERTSPIKRPKIETREITSEPEDDDIEEILLEEEIRQPKPSPTFSFEEYESDYGTEGGTDVDSKSTSMASESPQISEGAVSPSFLSISESQEERLNTPKPLKLEPNQMEIIDLEQTDDITEEGVEEIIDEPMTEKEEENFHQLEVLSAKNEISKNENDLVISDVESGLSIRDFGENDDIIEETGSNGDDIERPMTTVPVLTKDKLIEAPDRKPEMGQEKIIDLDSNPHQFQDHVGPLAMGCGKIVIVFGSLLVATYSLI